MQTDSPLSRFLSHDKGAFILLWLAGLYLRMTVLAAPPLTPTIGEAMDLGQAAMGALTTLPTLLLAAFAIPGAFITGRLGARRTVVWGLMITAGASALRGAAPGPATLFGATFLMGMGIAGMQPALPALVRRWCPGQIGFATAVYTNGLLVGEILSSGLTLPVVLPLVGGSWRAAIAVWSLPAALVVLGFSFRPTVHDDADRPLGLWWPDWSKSDVWILGLLLGGTAILYFGTNAYLPNLLHAKGRPELVSPALISLNAVQLASSALLLVFSEKLAGKRWPLTAMGLTAVAGMAGAVTADGAWVIFFAGVVGFCSSFMMILLLALPPLIGGRDRTASLAAGMFTVSYVCSFVVPFIGGLAWDATGLARAAFIPLGGFAAVTSLLALRLRVERAEIQ